VEKVAEIQTKGIENLFNEIIAENSQIYVINIDIDFECIGGISKSK
jgi:hypothetical protein